MPEPEAAQSERHLWVRADAVKPGDRVLCKVEALEVTHSQVTEAGYWMLRFPHGVLYINAAAPVALVNHDLGARYMSASTSRDGALATAAWMRSRSRRWECGRCGAEVREGKTRHFCGEPYPLKVTTDIREVEYVPASQLQGAVDRIDAIAAEMERAADRDEQDPEGDHPVTRFDARQWAIDVRAGVRGQ